MYVCMYVYAWVCIHTCVHALQDLAAQEKEMRNNCNKEGEAALAEKEAALLKREQELLSRCVCKYLRMFISMSPCIGRCVHRSLDGRTRLGFYCSEVCVPENDCSRLYA